MIRLLLLGFQNVLYIVTSHHIKVSLFFYCLFFCVFISLVGHGKRKRSKGWRHCQECAGIWASELSSPSCSSHVHHQIRHQTSRHMHSFLVSKAPCQRLARRSTRHIARHISTSQQPHEANHGQISDATVRTPDGIVCVHSDWFLWIEILASRGSFANAATHLLFQWLHPLVASNVRTLFHHQHTHTWKLTCCKLAKPTPSVVQTCKICKSKRRYTSQNPNYQLFSEKSDVNMLPAADVGVSNK